MSRPFGESIGGLKATLLGMFSRPTRPWHTLLVMYVVAPIVATFALFMPKSLEFDVTTVSAVIATSMVFGPWILWRRDRLIRAERWFLIAYATMAITFADLSSGSSASPFVSLHLWPVLCAALLVGLRGLIAITGMALVGATASILLSDTSGDGLIRATMLDLTLVVTAIATRRANRQVRSLLSQLEERSRTDPLTGALNRRAFDERLSREVGLAARGEAAFLLVILDLDHFKDINDRHGHAFGDEALIRVARTLRGRLRTTDEVFRIGGDEFAVLLPWCALDDAERVLGVALERLRGAEPPLTLSVGVASCPEHGCEVSGMMRAADSAMYAAKGAGRDRICIAPLPRLAVQERAEA